MIFTTKIQALWLTRYKTKYFSGIPIAYFGVGMDEQMTFTDADKDDPTLRLVQEFFQDFFKQTKTVATQY